MTETIQPCSWKTEVYATDKDLHIQKPETENNMGLFLSVLDSLNNLYEKLSRLNYLVQKKTMEQILYQKKAQEE